MGDLDMGTIDLALLKIHVVVMPPKKFSFNQTHDMGGSVVIVRADISDIKACAGPEGGGGGGQGIRNPSL